MQHSIPRFPSSVQGTSSLIREGNEEKVALSALFSLHRPDSPPLEMILHRTRLDGAISPMKSILFLGPFSSLFPPSPSKEKGGRWENRRAVAEEEEKPDEIGKGSRGEREFIGAQFSAE